MPYQNNIPLAADELSKSQGDINGNFQILGAIGGIPGVNNSSGINTAPGAGFNYLFLTAGNNPPAGSVFANSNALFSSAVAGVNELFVNKNNQAGAVQIPFTKSNLSTAVAPAYLSFGFSYLPSGILLKWGYLVYNNGAVSIQGLNAAGGPAFTAVFSVQVTAQVNGATQSGPPMPAFTSKVAPVGGDFQLQVGSQTITALINGFFWLAIGY